MMRGRASISGARAYKPFWAAEVWCWPMAFLDSLGVSWEPSDRIRRLPRPLWPAAILAQEARNRYRAAQQPMRWQKDVWDTLAYSVSYVHFAAVEGDIAEFGTMTGRSARCLARSLAKIPYDHGQKEPPRLHLFDSFEGLPPAHDPVDRASPHVADGTWGPGTCVGLRPEQLRA